MAANPTPQAPQNALEGGVATGSICESRIIQGVLSNARRLYAAGYLTGEKAAEFEALCAEPADRYRAALARGVWWG